MKKTKDYLKSVCGILSFLAIMNSIFITMMLIFTISCDIANYIPKIWIIVFYVVCFAYTSYKIADKVI